MMDCNDSDSDSDSPDSIVLNVYSLEEEQQSQSQSQCQSFFSSLLPRAGLGAYHTSVDVNQHCYTYGVGGIAKTSVAHKHDRLPVNAKFLQSIRLGSVRLQLTDNTLQATVHQCVNTLRAKYFTDHGYHLMYRNCNHFTETFATALIVADALLEHADSGSGNDKDKDCVKDRSPHLDTYPRWINRLARTGSHFITPTKAQTDATTGVLRGIVSCNVTHEAIAAAGLDGTIGRVKTRPSTQKKELTEAQKRILAKLGKK